VVSEIWEQIKFEKFLLPSTSEYLVFQPPVKKKKVKLSRSMPWRHMGGEEV
jgi:hypothetical protein